MNLNKRLTIEQRDTIQDSVGQTIEAWQEVDTVWGSLRPIRGREFFSASGQRAEITHEVIIRHGATVAPRDRIVSGQRVFDVQSVINIDERRRYLKLMVIENGN